MFTCVYMVLKVLRCSNTKLICKDRLNICDLCLQLENMYSFNLVTF